MDSLLETYRIFRAFKKAAMENNAYKKRLVSFASPSESVESLSMSSATCVIDPEWIDMIESKVPFLMNAVAEERQFVRSEGEVLPIERVRGISKESIEDLGKHSNYLTHDPATTGGKVIPDRLLIAKKENDYKVYENRFLYTCLIYLNQFLEVRLNEIVAVSGRYEGNSHLVKKFATPTANLDVEFTLHETRLNDPIAANRGGSAEAVRRISSALATTRMLLNTPLMKDVSTAPLVKSPITKTNVIRFDPNFREALELFHFLHSYDKKGYEIVTHETNISPFKGRNKEDFLLMVFLDAYLTYIYGNEIDKELHIRNDEEEKKAEKEALEAYRAKLAKTRREMDAHEEGPEAYILLIEEGEKLLEKALAEKEDEISHLKEDFATKLKGLAAAFDQAVDEHEADCVRRLAEKEEECLRRIQEMEERMQAEIDKAVAEANEEKQRALEESQRVQAEAKEKLEGALAELDAKIQQIQEEAERKIEEGLAGTAEREEAARKSVAEKQEEVDSLKNELSDTNKQLEEEKERSSVFEAQLIALLARNGKTDFEEMTTKEKFAYLDAQKKAFEKYYQKQWALTKKAIRKEAFSAPDPKAKKKDGKGGKEE